MKKQVLLSMCLTASLLCGWGGVNSTFANSTSTQVFAVADDGEDGDNDDPNGTSAEGNPTYKVGDETNGALLEWKKDKGILIISGWGDLSKITITDANSKVFSDTGAGKVYTKTTSSSTDASGNETSTTTVTAVKQGDLYNASTSYYEAVFSYTAVYEGTIAPTSNGTGYSVASKVKANIPEGYTLYNCYFDTDVTTVYNNNQVDLTDGYFTNGVTNLDGKQGSYHYYCLVKGTLPTDKNNGFSITDGLGSENGDYQIILLTDDNFSTYIQAQVLITASVDNLYVKQGDTYTHKPNGSSWQYESGQTLYTGTSSVSESPIEDNATYFGTTHADYLQDFVGTFAQYLPNFLKTESNITYSNVEFRTRSGEKSVATINNEFTCTLIAIPEITTLNLEGVGIHSLNPRKKGNQTEDPTFSLNTKGSYDENHNTTLTTLYTPQVLGKEDGCGTLQQGVFFDFAALKHLYISEGITTLGESCLDETQQGNTKYALETLSFPNSLKVAEKNCMAGQTGVETLTFPVGMQEIKEGAFQSTNPKDVYFLGTDAPKVAKYAWGENNYISNNSMNNKVEDGEIGKAVTVEVSTGYAVRANYITTQNGWMTMLHYPSKCTREQAAKYTDLTRTYKKIVYGDTSFEVDKNEDGTGIKDYYYEPGQETEALKGTGNATSSNEATKKFTNMFSNGTYGGNYDGGYDDMYLGTQYQWPSMGMAYRATVVAQNNKLWDGVTSISEGIKAAAKEDGKEDSSYSGDGTEYIGLHQFVFAKGDVTSDDTKKWDMSKYADGLWHTICMPFNMTKADMKVVFGASGKDDDGKLVYDIRLCKFNRVTRVDGDDAAKHIKLYFNDEQFTNANDEDIVLQAHTSYMIKAYKKAAINENNNVTNEMLDYVMQAGNPTPTNIHADDGQTPQADDDHMYYFIGTYLSDISMPQYSYFFTKEQKYRFQTTTKGKWTAYTSVVEAPVGSDDYADFFGGGNSSPAKLFTGLGEDDEDSTTAIDRVTIIAGDEIVSTNDNVYNLNGQLVSTNGRMGLPKGIYVQGGKKFVVR